MLPYLPASTPVPTRSLAAVLLLVATMLAPPSVQGQGPDAARAIVERSAEPAAVGLDERLFRAVYDVDAPAFTAVVRGADASAYPLFYGGPVAALLYAASAGGGARGEALRYGIAWGATNAIVTGLKVAVQRARPYNAFSDVVPRTPRYEGVAAGLSSYSFPSGHAANAFVLATALTVTFPEWYVATPAYAWAASVALSRLWLGVHYPSDVAVGALIGTGLALGTHAAQDWLTPAAWQQDEPVIPPLVLQVKF